MALSEYMRRTTKTTVRPRIKSPLKHLSTIHLAVCTSRAAKTSSRSKISAEEYTARARVIRAYEWMSAMLGIHHDRTHLLSTTSCCGDRISKEERNTTVVSPQRQSLLSNFGLVTSLKQRQVTFQAALVDD